MKTSCEPLDQSRSLVRYKHGTMPVVGLTGGIGGGKSEVARMLAGAGFRVIDADLVGHELLEDPGVQGRLVDRFGPEILVKGVDDSSASRRIDRPALAAIVFADPEARRDLEFIVHPLLRRRFIELVAREAKGSDPRPVVLDAAILLEAGWDDLCDVVVFVDSPRELRMSRALAQRGWSPEVFEARERAQWPCDLKRRRAGVVVTNDGQIDSLRREVDRLITVLDVPSRRVGGEQLGSGAREALSDQSDRRLLELRKTAGAQIPANTHTAMRSD